MADDSKKSRQRPMSFSSEKTVVQRWFGGEVLDHSPSSIRSDFIKSGRAPLLLNHDMRQQIGVVDSASFGSDKIGRAVGRFGRAPLADDALRNVDDDILMNTSVGYRVHEMVLDKQTKNEDIYRVTDWEPYEVSLVSVPADPIVGVGRSAEVESDASTGVTGSTQEEVTMSENTAATADSGNTRVSGGESGAMAAGGAAAAATQRGVELNSRQIEDSRIAAISNMCKANNIEPRLERLWVTSGASVEVVSGELLRVIEARGKSGESKPLSDLGLTDKEVQRFSLVKAIRACADQNWSDAGFEAECSRTIGSKVNKPADPKRFFVPYDVQRRGINAADVARRDAMLGRSNGYGAMTRADTVGVGNQGGYLVATELVSFIDLLRNRAVAFRMGARPLSGLVGNVTIPKLSAAGTAYWLGSETTQITEKEQTFSQLALTPKNVGGYTEISRQLLMQSTPDVEGIVNSDLAIITALAVDLGAIRGTGTSGQPVGIINTTNIGSESAITSTGTFASVLDMQTLVANANVTPVRGGYVAPFAVSALLATRTKFANTYSPIWDGTLWDGDVCGFPGMGTKQMPSTVNGDANNSLLFGDWDQLVIGEWGVLELEVNPYANFQAGIIGVRSFMTVDIGLRYPGAFSYCTSVS